MTTPTMAELVAEHNRLAALTGAEPTKRFSDRAAGERRIARLCAMLPVAAPVPAPAPAPAPIPLFVGRRSALAALAIGQPNVARERAERAPRPATERSAKISASWADPEVRADRLTRVACRVSIPGTTGSRVFPSVPQAFKELGLPVGRMIRVRMEMKHAGSVSFEGRLFERVDA